MPGWTGGVGPYFISVLPGGQASATPLEQLGYVVMPFSFFFCYIQMFMNLNVWFTTMIKTGPLPPGLLQLHGTLISLPRPR